jgi:chromosome segregation ATPase
LVLDDGAASLHPPPPEDGSERGAAGRWIRGAAQPLLQGRHTLHPSGAPMAFLAKLAGKRDGHIPQPVTQVEELLVNAREERERLETLLSSLKGDDVDAVPRVVAQLEQRGRALAELLDEVSGRVDHVRLSAASVDALEARIAALEGLVLRAESRANDGAQRAEELGQRAEGLQDLVSAAQSSSERLDALVHDERLGQVLSHLPSVLHDCGRVIDEQAQIAANLEQVRNISDSAMKRIERAADEARQADEHAGAAEARVAALERKLDEISQCQVMAFDAAGELQNLNALAEHVNLKMKALENQQQTIDRALLDSRRTTEMVWEMDAQIARLREGSTFVATVEETVARLDRIHQDSAAKLEEAERDRRRLDDTLDHQRQRSLELVQTVQTQLDRLALSRTEIDTLGQRLAAAESGLANNDRQLAALQASEQALSELQDKLNAFGLRANAIGTDIVRIEQKQPFLHALDARLDELDGEIRRTTVRVEGLTRRRQELDALKAEFDSCEATYAQVRTRADELRDHKHQFSVFAEQARGFLRSTPELEASIRTLNERVADTTHLAERALAIRPQVEELGGRLELLLPRFPLMEELQARLGALNDLSGDIDHKLAAQVYRQADLEQARVMCEGLATQIADAQQKLALLEAAQSRLASVPEQMAEVQASLAEARNGVATVQREQDAVIAHKLRLAEIHDSAAALFDDIASRLSSVQSVQSELERAGTLKDDLYQHLGQIQKIEREAYERHQEAESLLEQCTTRWKLVDQRRADLATVEQSLAGVETRMQTLERLAESLDSKIASVGERNGIVLAVKQEVDAVHGLARKCQDDLNAIADQWTAIGETRAGVDRLSAALAGADEKLVEVERRSAAVEDVRRKADAVVRLLDDVRVTLDTVGEHKAVVDHVTEMLAQFEDAVAEARGTTKALQAERKLAQRIVENVRHIHARAGAEVGQA